MLSIPLRMKPVGNNFPSYTETVTGLSIPLRMKHMKRKVKLEDQANYLSIPLRMKQCMHNRPRLTEFSSFNSFEDETWV